jgi:peptide/nickel transport system substrate-binding protein
MMGNNKSDPSRSGKSNETATNDSENKLHIPDLSRRQILSYTGAGGLAAVAGCLSETGDDDDDGERIDGGHVRISLGSGAENLTPFEETNIESYLLADRMYSMLVEVDHDLELQPDLALEWESNENQDEWTFQLRDDATFHHNGDTVTADDVKASVEAIMDPEIAPEASSELDPLEEVTVDGDYEVTLHLEHPNPDFPYKMATRFAKIAPQDVIESRYDELASGDFGSGAFILDDYETNNYYTLVANEDYYRTDEDDNQLPYVDKLTVQVEPDDTTRISSLEGQRTDILRQIDAGNFQDFENDSDIDALQRTGGQFANIVMPFSLEPFDDLAVRQALKYAIDKEEILEGAYQGYGEIGYDTPIHSQYQYFEELEDPFGSEAQPEQARDVLAEAGYEDGIELPNLLYSTGAGRGYEQTAILFQEQCAEAGIEFDIENMDWDRLLAEYWNSEEHFYISRWGMRTLEEDILTLIAHSEASANEMKWENEEFDTVLEDAMQTPDPDEKQALYTDALQILHEEGGWIIPAFQDRLGAKGSYVGNFDVEPTGTRSHLETVYLTEDHS